MLQTESNASGRRILIVDDDPRFVETIARGLRDLDSYEVHALTSGAVAREALHQSTFDLLIADWRMPDVDGLTLIHEARECSPQTVTVLMTAFACPEVKSLAEGLSVQHYLEKPFDIDELIGVIESVFPRPPAAPLPADHAVLKVILGGDANVGKTSLIQRYCTGQFDPGRAMTIGIDFHVYEIREASTAARLVVWDLGGQERFAPARQVFYRGTQAVGLVFDASNRHSFYNLVRWWREVREHLDHIPVLLLANKIDLPRQVPREESAALARAWEIPYYETSCVSGAGVTEFFESLARHACRHAHELRSPAPRRKRKPHPQKQTDDR